MASSQGCRFRTVEDISPQFEVQAEDYLSDHGIKGLYESITEQLVLKQPSDPLQFMIDYLSSGGAPAQEQAAASGAAEAAASFTEQEVAALYAQMDKDASAGLDVGEVVKGMQKKGDPLVARARKAAAQAMGIDASNMQEGDVYDFFDSLDRDGNGLITLYVS